MTAHLRLVWAFFIISLPSFDLHIISCQSQIIITFNADSVIVVRPSAQLGNTSPTKGWYPNYPAATNQGVCFPTISKLNQYQGVCGVYFVQQPRDRLLYSVSKVWLHFLTQRLWTGLISNTTEHESQK